MIINSVATVYGAELIRIQDNDQPIVVIFLDFNSLSYTLGIAVDDAKYLYDRLGEALRSIPDQ